MDAKTLLERYNTEIERPEFDNIIVLRSDLAEAIGLYLQSQAAQERPPVPGLTEDGYDYAIGGIIGVRLLLEYAMDGLQKAHDRLRDDPQAEEDLAAGAAVRELDNLDGTWNRLPGVTADARYSCYLIEPGGPVAFSAPSVSELAAKVRARLGEPAGVPCPPEIRAKLDAALERLGEQPAPEPVPSYSPEEAKAKLDALEPTTVPAEVAEALRLAGARWKRGDDAIYPWHTTYANGDDDHWPRDDVDWELVVEHAQANDNRPALEAFCRDNGGEEAAVLAECNKRGWEFARQHNGPSLWVYTVEDEIGGDWSSAFDAACAAAEVPTPWGPVREEAEEWTVPETTREWLWKHGLNIGLMCKLSTRGLNDLCRWVHEREEVPDDRAS